MKKAILGIDQLKIPCIIGIYPEERQHLQLLLIDTKIQLDLDTCFESKKIHDTLDYTQLAELCQELLRKNDYFLLEIFAHDLLDQYFQKFPIDWAWVRVKKPTAIPNADYAYVELERNREAKQ